MTEQITLMRLWDSPRMKSYTTMQNIKGFAGTGIPRTTTQINMGRSRNRHTRLHWLPLSPPLRGGTVCLPQNGILMQWPITPIWEFSKHREVSGQVCPLSWMAAPCISQKTQTSEVLQHLCFSASKLVEGAATTAPAPSAACLHDTKLLTNLALSEFSFFKTEIIIPPYLRGLVNVYTAV